MAWKQKYETQNGSRYRVGWRPDPNNPKKVKSKTFIRSRDADAFKMEVERREQLGSLFEEEPQTFGEFAGLAIEGNRVVLTGSGWFERYRDSVKPSSFERRLAVRKYLAEFIPHRLDRISAAMLEEAVGTVFRQHPRQARALHETVCMVLRSASVRGQKVQADVFRLKPPVYKPQRARRALSTEEVDRLADESTEPHLIRFAAFTGLRQGELFALREEDVRDGVLHVTATAYKGRVSDKGTKTEAGKRTIPLPSGVIEVLKAQREEKLRRGLRASPYIFPAPRGGVWWVTRFDEKFRKWVAAAELGDLEFHDLRSTFASWMVKANVHPKVLQELMGHTHYNVTMDLYTVLDESQKHEAMAQLQRMRDQREEDDAGHL